MGDQSSQASIDAAIVADRAGIVDFNIDPPSPLNLSGSRILVTGGASGLGEGFARKFCTAGAHVVIADLNRAAGETLTEGLVSAGHSAHRGNHKSPCSRLLYNSFLVESSISWLRVQVSLAIHPGIWSLPTHYTF